MGQPFTDNPRTASFGNVHFPNKHANFGWYQETYPAEFERYFKFTIVRNPFDRLVSAWRWNILAGRIAADTPLRKFIIWKSGQTFAKKLKLPGLSLEDSLEHLDLIGRFENIDDFYRTICHHLNLDRDALLHTNRTGSSDPLGYRSFYDKETVELAKRVHTVDLETFGYSF